MFEKLIIKLAKKFNSLKIPYMIIGGQAVLVYGEPRMTRDIDITLGLNVSSYKTIISLVKELKLKVLPENSEKFVNEFMVLPVMEESLGIKIDLIFSFTLYEQEAIKRVNKILFGETNINFASLEDIIIHKIFAGRERDIEDLRGILLKNKSYDKNYILKWLKEFDELQSENYTNKFLDLIKELDR